jgi:UDP-glucose 4-epimerase
VNRVIITGANGFIGKHLVKKLLSCKLHSLALISNTPNISDKYLSDKKFLKDMPIRFYTADIRDRKAISDIFLHEKADTCIHLAAKISVAESIKNPDETMDINVNGTLNVLEACHKNGVNNLVFASSAAVYGDVKELPICENQRLKPLSPYGSSKMLAEKHVSSYARLKKIQNTISLRIFNVYGPAQTSESDVITKFAKRLSNGLPPIIYGDGKHTRDFISVGDVTEAIVLSIRAMQRRKNNYNEKLSSPAIFNVGTGIPTSIKDLAQKMIYLFGLDLHPISEEGRQDNSVILHSYADMTRTKDTLHFAPKKTIDMGLKEMIEPMLIL